MLSNDLNLDFCCRVQGHYTHNTIMCSSSFVGHLWCHPQLVVLCSALIRCVFIGISLVSYRVVEWVVLYDFECVYQHCSRMQGIFNSCVVLSVRCIKWKWHGMEYEAPNSRNQIIHTAPCCLSACSNPTKIRWQMQCSPWNLYAIVYMLLLGQCSNSYNARAFSAQWRIYDNTNIRHLLWLLELRCLNYRQSIHTNWNLIVMYRCRWPNKKNG